jgi:hypothetical protein
MNQTTSLAARKYNKTSARRAVHRSKWTARLNECALNLFQVNAGNRNELSIAQRPAIGKIQMTALDDLKTTIRRNKLLGMWAAEKLGLVGRAAETYADALAVGTVDPERSDVFSKIRKDFDAAGVVQSDEQILCVMSELVLQAANQMQATRGGALDAAAAMLARNLTSR